MKFAIKKFGTIGGVIAALAMTASVQAIPITGNISMNGLATFDTSDVDTATTVTGWPIVFVGGVSGAFSSVGLYSSVTMTAPWVFNPSTPTSSLWSVGGFTFDLISDSVVQGGNFLDITGYGTISSSNPLYDPTSFTWNFSTQNPPPGGPVYFVFSAYTPQTPTPVPDGGLTVAFLGLTFAGLEGLRRKLSK
jgi:hypothetical protein